MRTHPKDAGTASPSRPAVSAPAITLGLGLILAHALTAISATGCDGPPPADEPALPPTTSARPADLGPAGARPSLIITRTNAALEISAHNAAGRVEARLIEPSGRVRGEGTATVRDGRWQLQLVDAATDQETYPMAGERIEVRGPEMAGAIGDADTPVATIVEIPELTYRFDGAAGRIVGRVELGAEGWGAEAGAEAGNTESGSDSGPGPGRVEIVIGRPELARAEAEIDADGTFALDVGAPARAGGASAILSVISADGAVRFVEDRRVPYVRVSLRPGDITGAMAPLSNVQIELRGADGAARGHGHAVSGPDGRFEAWVRDADGRRIRPVPGDRLRVGDGRDDRDWRLPVMSGGWERASGDLAGAGSPGSAIEILMWNPWHSSDNGESEATVGSDGAWSARPPAPIRPATHYYITERFPSGDELYFCYQVPILHAESGSPIVQVEALWEVEAELELRRAGEVVGRAAGGGPWSGNLELSIEDSAGRPVPAQPGDRLIGRLDDLPVDVEVAALEAAPDGDGGLAGRGPVGQEVGLAAISPLGERVPVGSDGRFALDGRGRLTAAGPQPGETLSVYTLDAEGHATHQRFVGPSLEVLLDPPRVSGRVDPRMITFDPDADQSPVPRLVRIDSDGSATPVELTFDALGRFDVRLQAPIEAPEPVSRVEPETQSGPEAAVLERFELSQAGVTAAVTIPAFSAALDASRTALAGIAPAYGIVDVAVWIGQAERPESLSTFADEDGRWRVPFGAEAPGRFTFDIEEVSRFEVRLRLGPNAVRLDVSGGRPTSAVQIELPVERSPEAMRGDPPNRRATPIRSRKMSPP